MALFALVLAMAGAGALYLVTQTHVFDSMRSQGNGTTDGSKATAPSGALPNGAAPNAAPAPGSGAAGAVVAQERAPLLDRPVGVSGQVAGHQSAVSSDGSCTACAAWAWPSARAM